MGTEEGDQPRICPFHRAIRGHPVSRVHRVIEVEADVGVELAGHDSISVSNT